MKKIIYISILALFAFACDDDDIQMGNKPAGEIVVENLDGNNVKFTAEYDDAFLYTWDLGNGKIASGYGLNVVESYYAFKDSYEVKLVVTGEGGATEVVQELEITSTDPVICSQQIRSLLTGGCDDVDERKTWLWNQEDPLRVSLYGGAYALYPAPGSTANFPADVLDDEFTFFLRGQYEVNHYGKTQCNWPPVEYGHTDDEMACDADEIETQLFDIYEEGGKTYFELGQGYLGYNRIGDVYEVLDITETSLTVKVTEFINVGYPDPAPADRIMKFVAVVD